MYLVPTPRSKPYPKHRNISSLTLSYKIGTHLRMFELPNTKIYKTLSKKNMQAALLIAPPVLPLTPTKNFSQLTLSPAKFGGVSLAASRSSAIKATTEAYETTTVDYSSEFSVFPAEACETIGGEACLADIFPEARLQLNPRNDAARMASEPIEREYLEYNGPKTVFCAEACDDLGGEFCSREYQKGVY